MMNSSYQQLGGRGFPSVQSAHGSTHSGYNQQKDVESAYAQQGTVQAGIYTQQQGGSTRYAQQNGVSDYNGGGAYSQHQAVPRTQVGNYSGRGDFQKY